MSAASDQLVPVKAVSGILLTSDLIAEARLSKPRLLISAYSTGAALGEELEELVEMIMIG